MADHGTSWRFTLENVSHGQFYLEPQTRDFDLDYVDDDSFVHQGFTAFPEQVAFFPEGDVSECDVIVELGSTLPSFDEAAQVISVPFCVANSEGVYFRTVDDCGEGDGYRVDVPPGEYDLLARIYPVKQNREGDDAFLVHCKVALTFLPKDTVGARVFRRAHTKLPDRIALHGNDGSIDFVPNE